MHKTLPKILLWYFATLKHLDVEGIVKTNKMRLSSGELSGTGFVPDGTLQPHKLLRR